MTNEPQKVGQFGPATFSSRRIIQLNQSTYGPAIYCPHSASGQAKTYAELAGVLEGVARVFGIEAAGLRGDVPPHRTVEEMANEYSALMIDHEARDHYNLLGYSTGGLIAYEIARSLRSKGKKISFLGLIDTALYHDRVKVDSGDDVWFDRGRWLVFWRVLFRWVDQNIWSDDHPFWKTDDAGRLAHIVSRLPAESQSRMWVSADYKEVARYYSFFEAHWKALRELYVPERLDEELVLFVADKEPSVGLKERWTPLARSVEVVHCPGSHYELMDREQVGAIASGIRNHLGL
jgi:thioesterase domain-containing protein